MKRVLAILLSVFLLCSVCPLGTFDLTVSAQVTGGSCGENLTWEYDTDTATLTVSGTGDMNDFFADISIYSPWYDLYWDELETVVIEHGVTSIGDFAFFDSPALKSVTIPGTVTRIGESAFDYCESFTSITLPYGVTTIDSYAFHNCTALTAVTIPQSIIEIKYGAFARCSSLSDVYYSGTEAQWNQIAVSSYYNEPLTGATIHYNYILTHSHAYKAVVTPPTCTSQGYTTYTCSVCGDTYTDGYIEATEHSYTTVVTSATCTEQGFTTHTCTGCGDTYIDGYIDATGHSYKAVVTPATCTEQGFTTHTCTACGDTYIDGYIDATGHSYTAVVTPPTCSTQGYTTHTCAVCGNAYQDTYTNATGHSFGAWQTITEPTCAATGKRERICSVCHYRETEILPLIEHQIVDSVCTVCGKHFEGYFIFTVTNGEATITGCDDTFTGSLTIPDTLGGYPVTSIGYRAFYYCSGLTGSLTIGNNVTTIGDYAFFGCSGLTGSLTIGNNVTTIGDYAFSLCSGLTGSLTIGNSVTTIGSAAFYRCSGLTGSLIIPDSVTYISGTAFYYCSGLTGSLTIGNSVTTIENGAFMYCIGLTGSLIIPDSVTYIGVSAFYYCCRLTGSLIIPDSVTYIGDSAFHYCSGLTGSLIIPDSVTYIGDSAFYYCCRLTGSLTIGNSVTTIGNYAFGYCNGLTGSLIIPDSVTSIGNQAFFGCIGLTRVTIPNSVTTIGDEAFYGCSGLTSVTIPNSVTSIGDYAFFECSGLTSVTIPNSVTTIGNDAFRDCSGLTGSLTIGNSVTTIGDRAFYGCSGLTSVTIPNSVTSIGGSAFYACNKLTYAKVLNKNVAIGSNAFYRTSGDKQLHLYLPKTATYTPATYASLDLYPSNINEITYIKTYPFENVGEVPAGYKVYEYRDKWVYAYTPSSSIIHWIGGVSYDPENNPDFKFIDYVTKTTVSDVDASFSGTTLRAIKSGYRALNISDCTLTANGRKQLALVPTTYQGETAGVAAVHANGVDVLANTLTLYGDKKDTLTIRTYRTGGSGTFTLLCDGEALQSNSTGNFTLTAKQLRKGDYTLRQGTVEYPLGITAQSELKVDVDLDDIFSFHVPNDVPLIGGKPFELSLAGISFHEWEKDDKVYITFGVERDSEDTYQTFRDVVDSIVDDYTTASEMKEIAASFQRLNGFKPWQGAATTGFERSVTTNFCGYCEISFDGKGNPHITAGQAIFAISGKIGAEWQTVIATVPIVLKLDVEAGAAATIGFALDAEDAVTLSGSLDITLPKITASAGVGLVKVADLSVYGSLTNTISRDLVENVTTATLNGEVGLSLTALIFSLPIKLWDFLNWQYYSSAPKRAKLAATKGATSLEDAISDMMQEENFTIKRANGGKPAEWLGAGGASRGRKSADTAALLQNNVYENAKAQTVTLADGRRLMVWLADIAERDDYNYTAVVYSIYDPATGSWSAPRILADDGTADFEPVLATDGTKTVAAWCNTNTIFSESVTLEEMASHCEISIAEFDSATGTFAEPLTLTDDEYYDCMPSLTIQNGAWAVSWMKNRRNDPLYASGENTIYIHKENGEEETTGIMQFPITEQAIGVLGNDLTVAYIADTDMNLTTTDDRLLFVWEIGEESQDISWGDQGNIAFARIDGENCLVWYKDGDLTYISALDQDPQVLMENAPDVEYAIVSDANKTLLLCAVPNMKNGEDGSNLVVYTYENGVFGEPEQVAGENGAYIGSISPYIDENGDLRATYLQKAVTFTEEDLEVTAALYDTAVTTSVPPSPIDTTYADLDGDGEINAEDLTVCTQALLLDGDADANNDGVTNILDLIFVKKILQAA